MLDRRFGAPLHLFPYPAAIAYVCKALTAFPEYIAAQIYLWLLLAVSIYIIRWCMQRFALTPFQALMAVWLWYPFLANIRYLQNSIIAFCCALLLFEAVERGKTITGALILSLMLYKPSIACFFIFWLILERQWKILLFTSFSLPIWFGISVAAAGGNLHWVSDWIKLLNLFQKSEMFNITGNISMVKCVKLIHPEAHAMIASAIAVLIGTLLLFPCKALISKASRFDRFLVILASLLLFSPHVMVYDAIFALPILLRIALTPFPAIIFVGAIYLLSMNISFWIPLFICVMLLPLFLSWSICRLAVSVDVKSKAAP